MDDTLAVTTVPRVGGQGRIRGGGRRGHVLVGQSIVQCIQCIQQYLRLFGASTRLVVEQSIPNIRMFLQRPVQESKHVSLDDIEQRVLPVVVDQYIYMFN
jgi:hypothetical protein